MVEDICSSIYKFQQSLNLPSILLGDFNIPHPENITSVSSSMKLRASYVQKFLRASYMIPLGVQTEKRCVDWICASASALLFVQEVKPYTGNSLGSLAASDHGPWSISISTLVRRKDPQLRIQPQKATKKQIKNFGKHLSLFKQLYSLPDDLNIAWLFLKHFILIAAALTLPCKVSTSVSSKKWDSIVSALYQTYLSFPNPKTEKTLLAAIHHAKAIKNSLHSQVWDHIMSTLPLQPVNSATRTISRIYRSMRPTSRRIPPSEDLAKVFFSQVQHPTPAFTSNFRDLPTPLVLTEDNVFRVLKKLPNGTAPGLDTITYELLKLNSEAMASYLLPLYTSCILQLTTPEEWSFANVLPLYKGKGKHNDPGSYRPISLLPTCRKVFELLLARKLYQSSYKFHPSQFGFVPQLSLEYAVILSHDHQIYHKNPSVLIDITKAFDTVDRNLLWRKLSRFSSPELATLVRSMFLEPKARILHPDGISSPYQVPNGVVQGSVLGPILFAIFINDFPSLSKDCLVTLFADDIRISSSDIQADTLLVYQYLQDNHLQLSIPKTHPLGAPVSFGQKTLSPVDTAVYLGFPFVNQGIDSETHLKNRISLARQALRKLMAVTPPDTSLPRIQVLLKQYVFPVLEFGLPLLNLTTKHYNKLDKFSVSCIYSLAPDLPTTPYKQAVLGAFKLLPYSLRILYLRTRLYLRLSQCNNLHIKNWLSKHYVDSRSCWRIILGDPAVKRFADYVSQSENQTIAYSTYLTDLWQDYLKTHTPFLLNVNPFFHNMIQLVDKPLLPLLMPPSPLNLVLSSQELDSLAHLLTKNDSSLYTIVKKLH